tara:strand:- start:848 stop:1867 length:1020 start_codon:yes stop_codon:yes gene_type:complete
MIDLNYYMIDLNYYMIIFILFILYICLLKKKYILGGFNFRTPDIREYYLKKNMEIIDKDRILTIKKEKKKLELTNYKLNCVNSAYMLDDKVCSKFLLQKYNFPTPKYLKIKNHSILIRNKVKNLINKYNLKYPLVIKPVHGSHGNGVKTDIKDFDNLMENIKKDYLIEEQLEGENYRILLIDDKVISSVVCREKPNVIGDGKSSFKELIKIKNISSPYNLMPDYDLLNQNNINDNTIIKKNKKIIINNVVNYHKGATLKYVPITDFHKDNIEMFSKINNIFGSRLCGIDFISTDISKSYKDGYGAIIELNAGAHELIHYQNEFVSKEEFFDEVFEQLFK